MSGHVLFFDFAYEEYLRIIERAAERGFEPIMNQPPMRQLLGQRGVDSRAFMGYAEPGDGDVPEAYAESLTKAFSSAVKVPGAADAFQVGDVNLLTAGGGDLVRSILAMAGNQALIVRIMSRLIEQARPRVIVLRSCMSAGQRAIQAVAAREGIPVLELSHGNPPWDADLLPPKVDWHYAVLGERERNMMGDRLGENGRLHLTGAPHWDDLYHPDVRLDKAKARETLGVPADMPFLVLAGSYAPGGTLFFVDESLRILRSNEIFADAVGKLVPSPLVAVRPHPGEGRQKPGRLPSTPELGDYRAWFTKRGVNIVHVDYSATSLVRDKAILFRAADAIVIPEESSTLITEAMILNRPCVVLGGEESPFRSFYGEQDGVVVVRDSAQLGQALDRILHDSGFEEELVAKANAALPELNYGHDGKSSERVVDLIEELAA